MKTKRLAILTNLSLLIAIYYILSLAPKLYSKAHPQFHSYDYELYNLQREEFIFELHPNLLMLERSNDEVNSLYISSVDHKSDKIKIQLAQSVDEGQSELEILREHKKNNSDILEQYDVSLEELINLTNLHPNARFYSVSNTSNKFITLDSPEELIRILLFLSILLFPIMLIYHLIIYVFILWKEKKAIVFVDTFLILFITYLFHLILEGLSIPEPKYAYFLHISLAPLIAYWLVGKVKYLYSHELNQYYRYTLLLLAYSIIATMCYASSAVIMDFTYSQFCPAHTSNWNMLEKTTPAIFAAIFILFNRFIFRLLSILFYGKDTMLTS